MKVLELFAGTRSIGKEFKAKGHKVYSIEWDKQHPNIEGMQISWWKVSNLYIKYTT